MEAQPVIKRSRLIQLIALFVFFLVCGFFSIITVLAFGGEDSSTCKIALFLLVFCRLAWQIYKRTFRFRDYFIYFAIVTGFCFWSDYQVTR